MQTLNAGKNGARKIKNRIVMRLLYIWRRNRDLNPGTVLPIYKLSKPAPATTWVFLHVVSKVILIFDAF